VELIKAVALGVIQGGTESLPVSSSGHPVIGSEILNFQDQGVVFDVFLHLGTLVAQPADRLCTGLPILPGLSRSGSTIFAGMALKVPREKVAEFSFIMSIPAIFGVAVLHGGDIIHNPPAGAMVGNLLAGTVMSAVSGYLAIKLLLDIIRRNRLHWFGYYCLGVAALGLGHYFFTAL